MKKALLFGLLLVLAGGIAYAGSVSVTNYNWLQLPADDVTPSIGSDTGAGGSAFGSPSWFRWGDYVWVPDNALTTNATSNYWAILELDQSRNITNVWVEFWAQNSVTITKFYIESSNNGTDWTEIGSHDYGSAKTGAYIGSTKVDVTDGNYKYVRVLLKAGDYTNTVVTFDYGGPGIHAIEPMGNGTLKESQVNWANEPSFSTTVTNYGLNYTAMRYNDGFLHENCGAGDWTGEYPGDGGNWSSGNYAQVDLKEDRFIDTAIVLWCKAYEASTFNVQYSTDGENFSYVSNLTGPVNYAGKGVIKYTFDRVTARYIRITDVMKDTGTCALMYQVLLYGTPPRPPGTTFTTY